VKNTGARSRARASRARAEANRYCGLAVILLFIGGCSLSHTPFQRRERQEKFERPPPRKDVVPGEIITYDPKKEPAQKSERLPDEARLYKSAKELKAEAFPLEEPCIDDTCTRNALDRTFDKLDDLDTSKEGIVRILHLGDSHVAADYITGTIRKALQYRFGDAGRGFTAIDQRKEYGGRRLKRNGFKRTRIVDTGGAGKAFGFSGMSLESQRSGARVTFKLDDEDAQVAIFYHQHKNGGKFRVEADELVIGEVDSGGAEESKARTFKIPGGGGRKELTIIASDPGVKLFGVSFENGKNGIFYDSIGPVGADARVYMSLNQKSFKEHLVALNPTLIVMMVGGNDALAMRKGARSLEDVRMDHERVLSTLQKALPEADCMLWAPMDAAERVNGQIVSKKFHSEVRNMQKAAATKMGCAFWDMFESMGAEGSFGRWHKANIMNDDLVHPRAAAGELLGFLFSSSFMEAYLGER
jgi:hypothetical protein